MVAVPKQEATERHPYLMQLIEHVQEKRKDPKLSEAEVRYETVTWAKRQRLISGPLWQEQGERMLQHLLLDAEHYTRRGTNTSNSRHREAAGDEDTDDEGIIETDDSGRPFAIKSNRLLDWIYSVGNRKEVVADMTIIHITWVLGTYQRQERGMRTKRLFFEKVQARLTGHPEGTTVGKVLSEDELVSLHKQAEEEAKE